MKKVFAAFLSAVLGSVLLMTFASCSGKISTITDMERYSDMQSRADKIDVVYDNHSGTPFEFTITNQEDVEEIMEILFSETLSRLDGPTDGDHTVIKIYQGEKSYDLSVRVNRENDAYFLRLQDYRKKSMRLPRHWAPLRARNER